jgi:hypothetical protein
MKLLRNVLLSLLGFVCFLVLAYVALWIYDLHHSPLTYAEMDFNHDGWVSPGEAGYASDYGTRIVRIHDKPCTEYFSLKDGIPLKVDCSKLVEAWP